MMRRIELAIAVVVGTSLPASAQKAEIDAANAKWIEFFNKGDFAGVGSLYTTDATAFPPGSAMVHGDAAIGAILRPTSGMTVSKPLAPPPAGVARHVQS